MGNTWLQVHGSVAGRRVLVRLDTLREVAEAEAGTTLLNGTPFNIDFDRLTDALAEAGDTIFRPGAEPR
jgi:hypothetical protein